MFRSSYVPLFVCLTSQLKTQEPHHIYQNNFTFKIRLIQRSDFAMLQQYFISRWDFSLYIYNQNVLSSIIFIACLLDKIFRARRPSQHTIFAMKEKTGLFYLALFRSSIGLFLGPNSHLFPVWELEIYTIWANNVSGM